MSSVDSNNDGKPIRLRPSREIKNSLTEDKAIEIFEIYNREKEFMS